MTLTVPEFQTPARRLPDEGSAAAADGTLLRHRRALTDNEAGLVYKNGKLAGVLAPGKRQLYWKGPIEGEGREDRSHGGSGSARTRGKASRTRKAAAAGTGVGCDQLGRGGRHFGRAADRGRQVR